MPSIHESGFDCPAPVPPGDHITLGHGGGGSLMQDLINNPIIPALGGDATELHDSARLPPMPEGLCFTTDSYVVQPLFFPGGDIGSLAVYGTVNDLAVAGARPGWLSLSFIMEEGLPRATLTRVLASVRQAAAACGVRVVTGDTKVVERGKGDGLYINTAGIGTAPVQAVHPGAIRPGDALIISGDAGRHGAAIMAARQGLDEDGIPESDLAPLHEATLALMESGLPIHCLRDLTRGGLSAACHELAAASGLGLQLEEAALPVTAPVQSLCEILGLEPWSLACEGRFIGVLPADAADEALAILRETRVAAGAQKIGRVREEHPGCVTLSQPWGGERYLPLPTGTQLPRIC